MTKMQFLVQPVLLWSYTDAVYLTTTSLSVINFIWMHWTLTVSWLNDLHKCHRWHQCLQKALKIAQNIGFCFLFCCSLFAQGSTYWNISDMILKNHIVLHCWCHMPTQLQTVSNWISNTWGWPGQFLAECQDLNKEKCLGKTFSPDQYLWKRIIFQRVNQIQTNCHR